NMLIDRPRNCVLMPARSLRMSLIDTPARAQRGVFTMFCAFEITVQRKTGDHWPVVAELLASGTLPVRKEGTLTLDIEKLDEVSPSDYGALLGQALFHDAIRDGFVKAMERSDGTLHVLLYVEADDLRHRRWERLAAPFDSGWSSLALNQRTPFALHLP